MIGASTTRTLGDTRPAMQHSTDDPCGVLAATTIFHGRWKGALIWWLNQRPHHFGELRRLLRPITPKVLTNQLRDLVRDGLVERSAAATRPVRVMYTLTPVGQSMVPLLDQLLAWWRAHELEINAARAQVESEPSASGAREWIS